MELSSDLDMYVYYDYMAHFTQIDTHPLTTVQHPGQKEWRFTFQPALFVRK